MSKCTVLYNVNQIIVEEGLKEEYMIFWKTLNKYLQKKYGKYYITLQLYENDEDTTLFYVIEAYYDKPGIEWAVEIIGEDISNIYDKVWGDRVERNSVFAFINFTRIIPKQVF